jgi:arginyl-tRNA synthetase
VSPPSGAGPSAGSSSSSSASESPVDPVAPLRERVLAALQPLGAEAAGADPAIHRSAHADFQADVALALARRLKRNPREVAGELAARLVPDEVVAGATVSGPGFINLELRPAFLAAELGRMLASDRLGSPLVASPQTVVIDYSAPNLAKEMHVGHIRPTVIGDAIVRVLEWQGHRIIRQNHVGDWGTPFGMLLEHLVDLGGGADSGAGAGVRELVSFYREARSKFDSDPAFAERARRRVVLLQGGDEGTLALWRRFMEVSVEHITELYRRLDITLRPEDVAGESRYNADLADVVAELERLGVARPSQGAICVFPPGFTGREGEPAPLIVRKQDGGYGYATTDLAALRYRVRTLAAQRLIYVVGAPQIQHLAMVFATARMAGWVDDSIRVEHAPFGSILGPDKKPFKTRAGETVSLASLVDEAAQRATKVVEAKAAELDPAARARIAEAVGVGALKYGDLSNDRIKDYVFDWDRMLSFDGNTAPYLMYAHARSRSILRKAEIELEVAARAPIQVTEPAERALALELLAMPSVIEKTAESLQPHRICAQLYQTATAFTAFFEQCPVLKAEEPVRASRLALCALNARVLARGLNLLGITAPDQM